MAEQQQLEFERILKAIETQGERTSEAIKEQGGQTTLAIRAMSAELRTLGERLVEGRFSIAGRNGNGLSAFAGPAFMLSVIVFAVTLLGQSQGSTRTEVLGKVKEVSDDVRSAGLLAAANKNQLTSIDERLKEVETQFSWMSDVANLERQHSLVLLEFVRQCPKCRIPPRDYWPLEIGRRGRSNGQ